MCEWPSPRMNPSNDSEILYQGATTRVSVSADYKPSHNTCFLS